MDGAVLVSPFTMYGYDASYAIKVHRKHPGRFGLVKPVDATDPGGAETIAAPGLNRVLATAARHALPVNLMCTGRLERAAQLAERHPTTQLVIDHLGLSQPHEPPPRRHRLPTCPRCWPWRRTPTWP